MVNVPLEKELVDNATVISSAQLSNQPEPSPIFTPLGMRYIIDQFEAVMKNGEPEETAKSDDEDWGDEPVKEEVKKSSDDEWEDEDKPSKDEEDNKEWDENWEE
jgi:hypothetical protein